MEKIRIGKEKRRYEISSIRPESANILEIVFIDAIPAIWGNITIYTEDGTEATTLTGYETVYKQDGQTVELSNDGSVYTPPASPEPAEPPGPYVPTLEEVRVGKKAEVSAACEQIIYAGINVTLSDGDHRTLQPDGARPAEFIWQAKSDKCRCSTVGVPRRWAVMSVLHGNRHAGYHTGGHVACVLSYHVL